MTLLSSLLVHEPQEVQLNMARWHGHFGTLMPFVRACDRLGGYGQAKPLATPAALPVADEAALRAVAESAGCVSLLDLELYPPACPGNEAREDWGAEIRCGGRIKVLRCSGPRCR